MITAASLSTPCDKNGRVPLVLPHRGRLQRGQQAVERSFFNSLLESKGVGFEMSEGRRKVSTYMVAGASERGGVNAESSAFPESFAVSRLTDAIQWARKYSFFPYPFVTACCGMEY